jgi:osmotically inducible protein OsmC
MATFSRSSDLEWNGDVTEGTGAVTAGTGAFAAAVIFPTTTGEPAGKTTPEELLAASHATCYGIGLRSLIGRRGGRARRVTVTATKEIPGNSVSTLFSMTHRATRSGPSAIVRSTRPQ